MTILIADDNRNIREFIKEILSGLDHKIIEATNGLMAVDNFIAHSPEIVLMDIKMKIMDGIEATEIIRKISSEVKIIMVTDYNEESLRKRAKEAGANDYVLKENLLELKTKLI